MYVKLWVGEIRFFFCMCIENFYIIEYILYMDLKRVQWNEDI